MGYGKRVGHDKGVGHGVNKCAIQFSIGCATHWPKIILPAFKSKYLSIKSYKNARN